MATSFEPLCLGLQLPEMWLFALDIKRTHTNLGCPVLLSSDLFCRSSFVVRVPFQRHLELRHILRKKVMRECAPRGEVHDVL